VLNLNPSLIPPIKKLEVGQCSQQSSKKKSACLLTSFCDNKLVALDKSNHIQRGSPLCSFTITSSSPSSMGGAKAIDLLKLKPLVSALEVLQCIAF